MRVGITWGVWDLLHVGHTRLLKRAREQCDHLIVGVTTDEAALARKGRRPVIPYEQRKEVLLALHDVDEVVRQDATFTKADAVRDIQPDVIFVGSDWTPSTFDGAKLGVPVVYLPRTEGVDTTRIKEWVRHGHAG